MVQDLSYEDPERYHVCRCPSCAALYSYQFTYEYHVNGSEDEETLTRLSHAEMSDFYRRHARLLEDLRQEIDLQESAAGSLGDYIDLAHPSPSQAEAAFDQMQAHRQAASEDRQRLQAQVDAFRQSCPEILQTWVEAHRRTCQVCLASTPDFPATPDADVTRYVARTTLEAWESILQGGEAFISTTTGFLPDYLDRLQAMMEG